MDSGIWGIEAIITVLSLRDRKASIVGNRRVRHYTLSKETEQAVDVKRSYVNGVISTGECKRWVYDWLEHHEFSREEWEYLDRSTYLNWLKSLCTKEEK